MAHNGTPPGIPLVPGGVPIIGARVHMVCSQGHVERASAPFTMGIPAAAAGEGPITLKICRVCWIQFFRMFGARELTDDEIQTLQEGPTNATEQS